MRVPMLDLKAQHASIRDDVMAAVASVFESQHFILGPEVKALESEIGEYLGVKHALGVSSGTDALLVALMALDIGPGDEVVTTPFSFFATAGCVARVGARPVFVDIDPVTFNIDPAGIEAAITPRTKAILPVHLYGQAADMDAILAVAEKHGLPVIEDAAQAIGSDYRGQRVGGLGAIGCFSFFPSKNLGGAGDGGLVTTNDDALAERLRILRVHGGKPKYYHHVVGGNFRLDAIQGAVLRVKLRELESWHAARMANAARYDALLADAPVSIPVVAEGNRMIWNQYTVRVHAGREARDALGAGLKARGIDSAVYYPVPLHLQRCFEDLGHAAGDFPEAERAAAEALSVPVHPDLTVAQIEYTAAAVQEILR
jgi:dTDP-4-amino-4,6-dideoxygalactose transaminase